MYKRQVLQQASPCHRKNTDLIFFHYYKSSKSSETAFASREWQSRIFTKNSPLQTMECRILCRYTNSIRQFAWFVFYQKGEKDANLLSCCRYRSICLLYTSDAADEEDSVDLGGRPMHKKKKKKITEINKVLRAKKRSREAHKMRYRTTTPRTEEVVGNNRNGV